MRMDATIDGRFVRVPNATHLAYDKWKAQVGDWVRWDDDRGFSGIGRMIARVHYAPALGDSPVINNWIEVLRLNADLTHAYPRWINPAWVRQVHAAVPDITRFLAWFAGPLPNRDQCIGMAQYGSLSANQQADKPEWDFAGKLARYEEYRTRAGREYSDHV